jgi:photosystem II stability/assembly factor-like uncharacterized protein
VSTLSFRNPYDDSSATSRLLPELAISLALALATTIPALAGVGAWTTGGPYISEARALAIHPWNPEILYLGTPEGVRRSFDGGASWSDAGNLESYVTAVAIDPSSPSTVYALRYGSVMKSADGGDSWSLLQTGVPPRFHDLQQVAVDPEHPSTVYVLDQGTDGCPGCYQGALWKSTDGGDSWGNAAAALPSYYYSAVTLDPRVPSTLYLGAWDKLYKSLDRGASWAEVTPPGFPEGERIGALAVDPRASGVVYAGATSGLYKSFDGGATWWQSPAAPREIRALTIDPSDPTRLFAATADGIQRSLDSGTSWERRRHQAGSANVLAVALDPVEPGTVYAATRGDGLVRSLDGGDSWTVVDTGYRLRAQVMAVAVTPEPRPAIYAGTFDGGVFRSTDGGRSWESRNRQLLRGPIQALAVAPSDPGILYAGTAEKVYRSLDGGQSWAANLDVEILDVQDLAIDPLDPSVAYASTRNGVYTTISGGMYWWSSGYGMCDPSCPEVYAVAVHPRVTSTLYAATERGLYRSLDRGNQWRRLAPGFLDGRVYDLAIDPSEPRVLYAGTLEGVYRSVDAGQHWTTSVLGLPIRQIELRGPSTLYGQGFGVLYRSVDAGASWQAVEPQGQVYATALAVHPWSSSTLYAATYDGVYDLTQPDCDLPGAVCLNGRRLLVEVGWRDFVDRQQPAQRSPAVSDDSAVFWFFDPNNWEMLVKVLDGTGFDDHFWVFAATASNVEYVLHVTDLLAGRARSYHNPSGQTAAALTETGSFPVVPDPVPPGPVVEEVVELSPSPAAQRTRGFDPDAVGSGCAATDTNLCLQNDRFRVEVAWRDFADRTGKGRVVPHGADDSGLLWFFQSDNWEMLVKVLDGCGYNRHHWVLAGATTNVEYTLTVIDTVTGEVVSYQNPLGSPSATITDTEALGGC